MFLLPLVLLQLLLPAPPITAELVPAESPPVELAPVELAPVEISPEIATAPEVLPLWGGDVRSLAVHPEDPDLLVAGTSAGHVYLSRDGGRSWASAGVPVPFNGWVVGTLRFDPHHPRRLWAGLWGVWGSGLLAVSDDLGATWRERRGSGADRLPPEPVYDLALVSDVPDLLYAGTLSGVWVSRDAGQRWSHLTTAYPEVHHVSSLLVHPEGAGSETLLAGTWRRAYRSDDGGLTWHGVFSGMVLDSEVFQLRPVPGRAGELWASTCGWVYHSTDLGERWTRFQEGLPERRTPSFAVLEDGRLLAGTIAGLYVSGDRGRSWQRRTDPGLSIRAIAHDSRRPARIVLATEGAGVWISTDGGSSFEPSSRGMSNVRIAALLVVGQGQVSEPREAEVLAAVHHAGPLSGIYGSTDGGRSFEPVTRDLPPVLELRSTGDGVYAVTEEGLFERTAGSTGWRRIEEPALAENGMAPGDRSTDLAPRPFEGGRLEPTRQGELYWGRGEVWLRFSAAHLWHRIAAGGVIRVLTTGDPRLPHLVVSEEEARPLVVETGKLGAPLSLSFPARDVSAAAVDGDRLLLGTTGYGLLAVDLPAVPEGRAGGMEIAR